MPSAVALRRLVPLALAFAAACGDGSTGPDRGALVWSDEFDGPAGASPSAENWGYDIGTDWGNAQLEWTTDRPQNVSLDGEGHLVITARREAFQGRQFTAARITTEGKRTFRYGRIEGRMKLPRGRGMWPAFWMLGANLPEVGWPQAGEIDIMEFRGQEPDVILGSVHGPGYSGGNAITERRRVAGVRYDNSFHDYAVEWRPDRIDFFVDGSRYHTVRPQDLPGEWVFDQPFYLILNIAVGGTFVGPPDANTPFPQELVVDWIRVYELPE